MGENCAEATINRLSRQQRCCLRSYHCPARRLPRFRLRRKRRVGPRQWRIGCLWIKSVFHVVPCTADRWSIHTGLRMAPVTVTEHHGGTWDGENRSCLEGWERSMTAVSCRSQDVVAVEIRKAVIGLCRWYTRNLQGALVDVSSVASQGRQTIFGWRAQTTSACALRLAGSSISLAE